MKALSLWQPWASLVAIGAKRIETRHWPTTYRGPIAIHAAKTTKGFDTLPGDCEGTEEAGWRYGYIGGPESEWQCGYCRKTSDEGRRGATFMVRLDGTERLEFRPPLGAIVATATLVDCVRILARGDALGSRKRYVAPDEDGLMRVWDVSPLNGGHWHTSWQTTPQEHSFGDYTPGRFAWLLEDVQPLAEPIPARGAQGLWDWEPPA